MIGHNAELIKIQGTDDSADGNGGGVDNDNNGGDYVDDYGDDADKGLLAGMSNLIVIAEWGLQISQSASKPASQSKIPN